MYKATLTVCVCVRDRYRSAERLVDKERATRGRQSEGGNERDGERQRESEKVGSVQMVCVWGV